MSADDDERSAALARLVARAASDGPALAVDPVRFRAYLEERLAGGLAAADVDRLAAGDLRLAHACLDGVAGAVDVFLREHGTIIEQAARAIDPRPEAVDELRQELVVRILVPEHPGGTAKLADFSGRGPLRAWLKMAARRLALNTRRDGARLRDLTESFAGKLQADRDVELSLIRDHHQVDFRAALAAALDELTVDERLILRLHYLEGLTSSELAPLLRTSRATAHRRVTAIRDRLHERLIAQLRSRVGGDDPTMASMLDLLSSRVVAALGVDLRERLDSGPVEELLAPTAGRR